MFTNTRHPSSPPWAAPPTPTATEEGRRAGGRLHGAGGWVALAPCSRPACAAVAASPSGNTAGGEGASSPSLVCLRPAPARAVGQLTRAVWGPQSGLLSCWDRLLQHPGLSSCLPQGFSSSCPGRNILENKQPRPTLRPRPPSFLFGIFLLPLQCRSGGVALLWLGLCFVFGRLFVFWFFFFLH